MAEMDALIPPLRMEEEEESEPQFQQAGFGRYRLSEHETDKERNERTPSWLTQILQEREVILANTALGTREKIKLLEVNHRTLLVLRGGRIKTFKTELVVFGILAFSAILLITLAWLNVRAKLPTEITLTFLGTTLGGVIATIAQKLGRI